jgi:hypothetical protein
MLPMAHKKFPAFINIGNRSKILTTMNTLNYNNDYWMIMILNLFKLYNDFKIHYVILKGGKLLA